MNTLKLNIREPYCSFILSGKKTIEGRLNEGRFKDLAIGDMFLIGPDENTFSAERITRYESFSEMLESEGVENTIPDKDTVNEATRVYYTFYTEEQEKEFGVLAIKIKPV